MEALIGFLESRSKHLLTNRREASKQRPPRNLTCDTNFTAFSLFPLSSELVGRDGGHAIGITITHACPLRTLNSLLPFLFRLKEINISLEPRRPSLLPLRMARLGSPGSLRYLCDSYLVYS